MNTKKITANNQYIIKGKLTEKEKEIKDIKSRLESIQKGLNLFFIELVNSNNQKQVNNIAKLLYNSGIITQYQSHQ